MRAASLPPAARGKVRFLMVTLDPERDTVDALQHLVQEYKLGDSNIEVARTDGDGVRLLAASLGIFGSIDMNRNDYQSGWDTDQFPDSVPEMARAYYEILRAGGFTSGGTNFDAKIRRQSLDEVVQEPIDLSAGRYRLSGRGYCTQPARALGGAAGSILVSRFDVVAIVEHAQEP